MTTPVNKYQFFKINYNLDSPASIAQSAFKDTATGKSYLLPINPQGSATDSLAMSYGKSSARKCFAINATIGLPIGIVVTAYKIVARVIKIIACLLPIPLGLTLKGRIKTILETPKFIAGQLHSLVMREVLSVYGIFKPLEAIIKFEKYEIAGIYPRFNYKALDERGFPLQASQTMTNAEITSRFSRLGITANIHNGEDVEGIVDTSLILETGQQCGHLTGEQLIECGQLFKNLPGLKFVELRKFGFDSAYGSTVVSLFPLLTAYRHPCLEELTIVEPLDAIHALPGQISVQALFDSNPEFKRLEIRISQDAIDEKSKDDSSSRPANTTNKDTASKLRDEAFLKVKKMHLKGVTGNVSSFLEAANFTEDSPQNDGESPGVVIYTVSFERSE